MALCSDPLSPVSLQGARVWIPDSVDVWRVAEITRGYKEGDTVLHLRLEGGSVRLELCSPMGPCCVPPMAEHPQMGDGSPLHAQTSLAPQQHVERLKHCLDVSCVVCEQQSKLSWPVLAHCALCPLTVLCPQLPGELVLAA